MRTTIAVALITYVLSAAPTVAQTTGNIFKGLSKVGLQLTDGVKDGCLPQPRSLRKLVEQELVRSKVTIAKDAVPVINIKVLGGALNHVDGIKSHYCVIALDISLIDCGHYFYSWGTEDSPAFNCVAVWSKDGFGTSDKPTSQQYINRLAIQMTREFTHDLEMDRLGKYKE